MEHSSAFIKEMTEFMKSKGVASFEISEDGRLAVSFDPRAFESGVQVTPEELKKSLGELFVNSEKDRLKEEEEYLYSNT